MESRSPKDEGAHSAKGFRVPEESGHHLYSDNTAPENSGNTELRLRTLARDFSFSAYHLTLPLASPFHVASLSIESLLGVTQVAPRSRIIVHPSSESVRRSGEGEPPKGRSHLLRPLPFLPPGLSRNLRQAVAIAQDERRQHAGVPVARPVALRVGHGPKHPPQTEAVCPTRNAHLITGKEGDGGPDAMDRR